MTGYSVLCHFEVRVLFLYSNIFGFLYRNILLGSNIVDKITDV